jgi:hypothetical protein
MKRYLIFAVVGPFVGGLLMLFAATMASGYWTETNLREVGKFFGAFIKTLQYSYLFGIVPALMVGAIDDILCHVRRIRPVLRMLIVGAIGFTASFFYGSRGPDTGVLQLLLNGLVGMAPAMLASWLSHRYADTPAPVPST